MASSTTWRSRRRPERPSSFSHSLPTQRDNSSLAPRHARSSPGIQTGRSRGFRPQIPSRLQDLRAPGSANPLLPINPKSPPPNRARKAGPLCANPRCREPSPEASTDVQQWQAPARAHADCEEGIWNPGLGIPDDFEHSVILKHPQYFRLVDAEEARNKYIECVEKEKDSSLTVCAIEKLREREYREKGADAKDIRFLLIVNFPPGFKIGKYFRIAMWKWQRVPYWSPYEDVSDYDLRSVEAQKRREKRVVATIHELLSLTVEKKIIAHFRMAMNLPKKLKDFLLQHQGIFYILTRGNYGKIHTVFLREAYKRGELVEPNDLYLARRKLAELILLSSRKARGDRELINFDRGWENNEMRGLRRDYVDDDGRQDFGGGLNNKDQLGERGA